jgi:hypothetical protein
MEDTMEPQVGKEYPESWDEHDKAMAESDRQLKLKAGDKVRMRIVSGPLVYKEFYYETGETDQKGKTKKKRIAIPFSSQLPGYDFKVKSMVEVVMCDGPAKGMHRIFEYGQGIAKQLREVKENYGSVRNADISIKREGSTMNDTKYFVQPVPASMPSIPAPKYDLEKEVRFSTREDINSMPPPVSSGRQPDSTSTPVTAAQVSLINSIGAEKDLDSVWFNKTLERKFQVKTVQELNVGQASELIDLMRQM